MPGERTITAHTGKTPLTLPAVNRAIEARGIDALLVHGRGYFYFFGPAVERCYTTIVPVVRVSQLPLESWMAELDALVKENNEKA